ncbi:hypothetical protein CcCBS67573_g06874 [Chytriomyces confervae]|uniref:Uncharacterized protein n=1 Tax=Chytriomyces confervae TaxID=246404 RepID=A0A507EZB0_9FUNG|nr:hypothetical protein CcCBS67573_g06874 [Chytriomyces confervae]
MDPTTAFAALATAFEAVINTAAASCDTGKTNARLRNLKLLRNSFASLLESCEGIDAWAGVPETARSKPEANSVARSQAPPAHFGDIMSLRETSISLPKEFSPLERILLTANGNVQRILRFPFEKSFIPTLPNNLNSLSHSAFYNLPITVKILKNEKTFPSAKITSTLDPAQLPDSEIVSPESPTQPQILAEFDRKVQILCNNRVVCTATSTVTLCNAEYLRLIDQEKIGIGQLFRYLNILPDFELIRVGRDESGDNFWRVYSLSSGDNVHCVLKEVFPKNVFSMAIDACL